MHILLIILILLLILTKIYFLVKAIKTKDNKNWIILFTFNMTSIISMILIIFYSFFNKYLGWNTIEYCGLCLIALGIYIIMLIINLIFKIVQVLNDKKHESIKGKLDRKTIRKCIVIPLFLVLLITFTICEIDYLKCIKKERRELNLYNDVKSKEVSKMADFLNDKYNMNLQESDCIYYREQDYTWHSDIFGNGTTYNIPYIAVFKYNNEEITAVDRNNFISDNKQLKDINKMVLDYYKDKIGIKFDYVEFRKSYGGSWSGNDNIINKILQLKFNKLITSNNIEEFLNCVLQESDLAITFYVKDDDNSEKMLMDKIAKKLDYLRNYSNVESVTVYGYDEDLIIKYKKINFPEEHRIYGNLDEDYYDGYKFGCYYVDSHSINFTYSLSMNLSNDYISGIDEVINGWEYNEVN